MTATSDVPTSLAPRRRVLFVGEAVTLAHVARPFALATGLDPSRFDVHLAWDPRYNGVLGRLPFPHRPIRTIPGTQFLDALAHGRPLYDTQTLREYVAEDRQVLAEVAPDVVVGDFRLSLSVSARLAGIPYVTITNAYWSPYARQRFPLPDLPMNRILGVGLASAVFRLARPLAFALHCVPLNRVRKEHGLPTLGSDLRRIYTDADYTLYADVPELVPTYDLPPNHRSIGPVLWSPVVEPPPWWNALPADRPVVYVTLGSSGRSDLLGDVLQALGELPVTTIAATAGRVELKVAPANAFVADYLPGEAAARRAAVVVCNGGSPTTQQALAAGKPVIGIASNMDQHLNMGAVERAGAGILLRAGRVDRGAIRTAVEQLLSTDGYRNAAGRLGEVFAREDAAGEFARLIAPVRAETPAMAIPLRS